MADIIQTNPNDNIGEATIGERFIEELYIPRKVTGDTLSASEFNSVPVKVNEIIRYLRGLDSHINQLISAAVMALNNIRLMTTQEYLAQGTWDARILYVCIDDGELMSVNLGLYTLAKKEGAETNNKGFAYSLPIIL